MKIKINSCESVIKRLEQSIMSAVYKDTVCSVCNSCYMTESKEDVLLEIRPATEGLIETVNGILALDIVSICPVCGKINRFTGGEKISEHLSESILKGLNYQTQVGNADHITLFKYNRPKYTQARSR